MQEYKPNNIEPKWQKHWSDQEFFIAKEDKNKEKWYTLIEFPYPSGAGLHVGHVRSYTALDIVSRKKRMQGYNVLYPIGWDAFGLPTENYAIKTGRKPQDVTTENVATFTRQLKSLGISFDWSREVNTTDPSYYKWTQWQFIQLFKEGLAYKDNIAINWCLSCKIGLANEEVVEGKCERCGGEVEKREKEQWMIAITKYADRLLADLNTVDYLPKIRKQQEDWIGRKEGINIHYPIIEMEGEEVVCFTTRPDTNFGATFVVLGPEHPLIEKILNHVDKDKASEICNYVKEALGKSEIDRLAEGRTKTGVSTGLCVSHRLLDEKPLPLYISDFVLGDVGTGAVVGVPAHDKRDFEFSQVMDIPVIRVVVASDGDESEITDIDQVQEEEGTMINSGFLNGMDIHQATEKIMDYYEEKGYGERVVGYKLRDWVFSRQRYWGEPIPLVYCDSCAKWVPIPDDQLPVVLPEVEKYEPTDTGESPLADMDEWVNTTCPECGGPAKRETDTMPNWAGSNWYFLRYTDAHNDQALASKENLEYWMPVDLYNGGMEHTTLHLLYSRFWHKFLFDIGSVPGPEPYARRRSHGMVLASDGKKMSKSLGNVVNPDDIIEEFGADTLRVYEMFMGPFDEAISWDENSLRGIKRFLDRIWRLQEKVEDTENAELTRLLHKTIKKITQDIDAMKFNTAVAQLMTTLNEFERSEVVPRETFKKYIILLSVFAPHIAEELWELNDEKQSISQQPWLEWDEELAKDELITIAIQVNGKVRDAIEVEPEASEETIKELVRASERVNKHLQDKQIVKEIFVPGKIYNIVVK